MKSKKNLKSETMKQKQSTNKMKEQTKKKMETLLENMVKMILMIGDENADGKQTARRRGLIL